MDIKDAVDSWKSILGFGTAIVVATVAIISYAHSSASEIENKVEQKLILMKAQSSLIHNEYYQEGRIERKNIEIKENQRELKKILDDIGDDEPTPRQQRDIAYLDDEILRLRNEIEKIRVDLNTKNE